jgi:hypothetical protein
MGQPKAPKYNFNEQFDQALLLHWLLLQSTTAKEGLILIGKGEWCTKKFY